MWTRITASRFIMLPTRAPRGRCAFFCTAAADSGADSRRPEFPPFVAGIPGANGFCGNSAGSAADASHDMEGAAISRPISARLQNRFRPYRFYEKKHPSYTVSACLLYRGHDALIESQSPSTEVSIFVRILGLLGVCRAYICGSGGSVAEWLACWTRAQKSLGSNRSRDAVG